MSLPLRQKLMLLADEIEEEHSYDIIRGKCSCGFKSRDITPIKTHYIDALATLIEDEGLTLP